MNRILLFSFAIILNFSAYAQIKVSNAIVPKYMQGRSGTNNNRIPFVYWAELKGLSAGATYRYYNLFDTLDGILGKGAGGTYFINKISGNIRRASSTSFTNPESYDSLVADAEGRYSGWFMNESNGNARFAVGNIVFAQIQLKDKAGTDVVKLVLSGHPIQVIDFGKDVETKNLGSALWDSTNAPAKSMVFLYQNMNGSERPISGSIVEDIALNLNSVSSIETFYKNIVAGRDGRWGLIIPNELPKGIRRVEYRDFKSGLILNYKLSEDGIWCGLHTENPANGATAVFLNSLANINLSIAASADTVMQQEKVSFSVISDSKLKSYTWNFGDNTSSKIANPSHQYENSGQYIITLISSDGDCEKSVIDTIFVQLITSSGEPLENIKIDIYPNPGNGLFTINTGIDGRKELEVYNLIGSRVSAYTTNQNNFILDLTSLEKGIYFLKLKTVSGTIVVNRLIIN